MISDKARQILLSRTNKPLEDIERLTEAAAWRLIYAIPSRSSCRKTEVCFTGFRASERDALESLAESRGMKTVGSITKNLDFLVAGDNAGQKKVEKAEVQGATVLPIEVFERMLETGELPE